MILALFCFLLVHELSLKHQQLSDAMQARVCFNGVSPDHWSHPAHSCLQIIISFLWFRNCNLTHVILSVLCVFAVFLQTMSFTKHWVSVFQKMSFHSCNTRVFCVFSWYSFVP